MIPTIGTAGTRYRATSRVWTAAAVAIEAAHITITMPARITNSGRRRTAVTVQNRMAITKAVDNALNSQAEKIGKSDNGPIRTGSPCRSIGCVARPCRAMTSDTCGTSSVDTGMAGSRP